MLVASQTAWDPLLQSSSDGLGSAAAEFLGRRPIADALRGMRPWGPGGVHGRAVFVSLGTAGWLHSGPEPFQSYATQNEGVGESVIDKNSCWKTTRSLSVCHLRPKKA